VPTIKRVITGDTPASLTLIGLVRSDNGATPCTLPISFVLQGDGISWVAVFTDAGNPPASYTYTYQINWSDGSFDQKSRTLQIAPAIAAGYLTVSAADAIAATMPASLLPWYVGANPAGADKLANLQQGFWDIEHAMRYQGRKYDPAQAQEFPRILQGALLAMPVLTDPFGQRVGVNVGDIADWDPVNNVAIVPLAVQQAQLFQADYLGQGSPNEERLNDIHSGVKQAGNSGMQESYDANQDSVKSGLCRRAFQLMKVYRLQTGGYR
jgi:hypothetical protein